MRVGQEGAIFSDSFYRVARIVNQRKQQGDTLYSCDNKGAIVYVLTDTQSPLYFLHLATANSLEPIIRNRPTSYQRYFQEIVDAKPTFLVFNPYDEMSSCKDNVLKLARGAYVRIGSVDSVEIFQRRQS
jgi:hypothetical protein